MGLEKTRNPKSQQHRTNPRVVQGLMQFSKTKRTSVLKQGQSWDCQGKWVALWGAEEIREVDQMDNRVAGAVEEGALEEL